MRGARLLFLASWVILLVLSSAVALLSIGSARNAYSGARDNLTQSVTTEQLREIGGDQAVKAFKGRRATAATWALGCALLSGWVVLVPYRRGERWAWWALMVSIGLSQFASLGRAVFIGTTLGTGAPGVILAFLLLGLLAGAPRMFAAPDLPPELR